MSEKEKKVNPEEPEKEERTSISDEDGEKVAAGVKFGVWDRDERRKPK